MAVGHFSDVEGRFGRVSSPPSPLREKVHEAKCPSAIEMGHHERFWAQGYHWTTG